MPSATNCTVGKIHKHTQRVEVMYDQNNRNNRQIGRPSRRIHNRIGARGHDARLGSLSSSRSRPDPVVSSPAARRVGINNKHPTLAHAGRPETTIDPDRNWVAQRGAQPRCTGNIPWGIFGDFWAKSTLRFFEITDDIFVAMFLKRGQREKKFQDGRAGNVRGASSGGEHGRCLTRG